MTLSSDRTDSEDFLSRKASFRTIVRTETSTKLGLPLFVGTYFALQMELMAAWEKSKV